MVSCSGFGLPLHAQLLRLFVTVFRLAFIMFVLQRDAIVRNAEASRNYSRKRTEGTHNKGQPANAGQQRYMSHKRQSPNQDAVKASNQHTTLTSHRTMCHQRTRHRHRGAAPTVVATGTHAAQIQLIPRRRGKAPTFIPCVCLWWSPAPGDTCWPAALAMRSAQPRYTDT